jgi:hypothetical protein
VFQHAQTKSGMCHEEWNSSSLMVPWKTVKETTKSHMASYLREKHCQKPMSPQAYNCNDFSPTRYTLYSLFLSWQC